MSNVYEKRPWAKHQIWEDVSHRCTNGEKKGLAWDTVVNELNEILECHISRCFARFFARWVNICKMDISEWSSVQLYSELQVTKPSRQYPLYPRDVGIVHRPNYKDIEACHSQPINQTLIWICNMHRGLIGCSQQDNSLIYFLSKLNILLPWSTNIASIGAN